VQVETFRALRAALDKGEKVVIPEFGLFMVKDVEGEDGAAGKKVIRFRARNGEGKKGKAAAAAARKNEANGNASGDDADED
jgi:nucleoid DNA-binding protein